MDKTFENKLQSKVNNFEADVPHNIWDKVSYDLEHPFETKLKDKLNGIGAFVGSGAWAAIESKLPNSLESGLKDKLSAHETPVNAAMWSAISQKVESMPGVFEDAMRDKVANHKVAPNPKVADAVFAKLDGTNRLIGWRRAISSAAAVLLLFGVLFMLPKPISKQYSYAYGNFNPASLNENIDAENLTAKKPNAQNLALQPKATSAGAAPNNKSKEQNNGYAPIKNDRLNKQNNLASTGNGGVNGSGANTYGNEFASENRQIKNGLPLFAKNKDALNTKLPSLALKDLKAGAFSNELNIAHLNMQTDQNIETPVSTNKVEVSLAASGGAFSLNTRPNGVLKAYDESFAEFNDAVYKTGSYKSLGANVVVAVSDKASILSGLQLTHAQNNFTFSIVQDNLPSSFNSLVDNGMVITNNFNPYSNRLSNKRESELAYDNVELSALDGDSIVAGSDHSITNNFFFVDLPIGFEFNLMSRPKSSVVSRFGAKVRVIAGANSYHANSDRDQIVEVSSAVSQAFYQTSMVGFGSIHFQKDVNENYEFFVGPEVNLNLTDINKSGTWMSMRPFQFGINLGLRQKIS